MARRDIIFQSCGVTCRGWLYTPDEGEGPFPAVVQALGGGIPPAEISHMSAYGNPEHSKVISDKATEFLRRQLVDRSA